MNGIVKEMNRMARRITDAERRRVIELWVDLKVYREIAALMDISGGAISKIVNDARLRMPDLDELRELVRALKKADTNVLDARRGAVFLERLNELNISMDGILGCISLLNIYGDEAGDVLERGVWLRKLVASKGKTYDQIVAEADEKARNVLKWDRYINGLQRQETTLKESIRGLEPLRALQDKLDGHNIAPARLDGFIERQIRLEELGFPPETAEILASELAKNGLAPQMAAAKLMNLLSQHGSLEEALANLKRERQRIQQDIERRREESNNLNKELSSSKNELLNLQGLIERENKQHQSILSQSSEDEHELTITRERLKEAGNTLRKIQQQILNIAPLVTLTRLVTTPRAQLEPSMVMKTVQGVIKGFQEHLVAYPEILEIIHRVHITRAAQSRDYLVFPSREPGRPILDSPTMIRYLKDIHNTLVEGYRFAARKA